MIPEITNKNIKKVLKGLSPTGREDVTGEMAGKIMQIKNYLSGIPVVITNGQNPKILEQVLSKKPVGTKLLLI